MREADKYISPIDIFSISRDKQTENIFFKKELKKYSSEVLDEKVQVLKDHFKFKRNVWSNYNICPIVFEVIEALKKELEFEYKNHI
jgi:DNA modification methylase